MRKILSLVLTLVLMTACAVPALAEAFPSKELTYLCGYGAGGGSDVMVRLMQPYAEKYFGQALIIENLSGAGGCTALTDYRTRAADGYTMTSFNTTPLLKYVLGEADYNYIEELDFIGCVVTIPIVVVVKADSVYRSIEELLTDAKARPEELIFASAGANSITHLAAELWQNKDEVKFTHMPFNGGTDALTALLNGTVDFEVASLSEVLTKHIDGTVRILASCTDTDIKTPDGESLGIPVLEGCNVKVFQGIAVHKSTPEDVKAVLAEGIRGICTDEGYIADMKAAGYDLDYMDREGFAAYLSETTAAFTAIVESANLK